MDFERSLSVLWGTISRVSLCYLLAAVNAIAQMTVTFPAGNGPDEIAFDGSIWVTGLSNGNQGTSTITKLSATDGALLGTFTSVQPVGGIAFDSSYLLVTNPTYANVSRLRVSDGAFLGSFPTGTGTRPTQVLFDGANIWVNNPNSGSSTVTKLRANDGIILGNFPTGAQGQGMTFDGANIWVTNQSGTVTKLRASDGALLGTFPAGSSPYKIIFDGANIWVTNYGSSSVTKLRASDGSWLGTFSAGTNPWGIAFDGVNIWVTNVVSNTVTKLRAMDGVVIGTLPTGISPYGIAFDGANVWVANKNSNTVTKFIDVLSCVYALGSSSGFASSDATTGSVTLNTGTGCAWSVSSNVSWITLTSAASGTGTTSVAFAVAANSGSVQRTGTITIAGEPYTITQAGNFVTPGVPIRINAGGGVYNDPQGNLWSPDSGFSSSSTFQLATPIKGTNAPMLYQSERWHTAPFTHTTAVPNGSYNVKLKFAEIFFTHGGQRSMNVSINGTPVLTNFDIVLQAGASNTAIDRVFNVDVTTGQIVIQFTGVVSTPKVSAIEITPAGQDLTIAPAWASLSANQTRQFISYSVGGCTRLFTLSPNIGTIAADGLYTAPASTTTARVVNIQATCQTDPTKQAFAQVLLVPGTWSTQDIGTPNAPGSFVQGLGSFLVTGAGDMGGTADAFRFAYQSLTGDGTITARIWPFIPQLLKAGVMMRDTTSASSANAFLGLWGGVVALLQARTATGQSTTAEFGAGGPVWVRLVRQGNTFTGYVSTEGNDWIQVGVPKTITMGSTILAGLAVGTAFGPAGLTVFDEVSVVSTPVVVSVDQQIASLGLGQQATFTATVTGTANTAVTWSISPNLGSINPTTGVYTAPASLPSTPQTVTVTATSVADPSRSHSAVVQLGSFRVIRVNAGGPATFQPDGFLWASDTGADAGFTYSAGVTVTNTTTPYLYLSEHFHTGTFSYKYIVPNGTYNVTLKFAEIYFTAAGQRSFHVDINGVRKLTDLDVFQAAGGANKAFDQTFPITVSNGQILITFTPVVSLPKVNGILIQ